eukprot:Rmarinus@m.10247
MLWDGQVNPSTGIIINSVPPVHVAQQQPTSPCITVRDYSKASESDKQKRVTIWNKKECRKIVGNAAPMSKNLQQYLKKHTDCEIYTGQDKLPENQKKMALRKEKNQLVSPKGKTPDKDKIPLSPSAPTPVTASGGVTVTTSHTGQPISSLPPSGVGTNQSTSSAQEGSTAPVAGGSPSGAGSNPAVGGTLPSVMPGAADSMPDDPDQVLQTTRPLLIPRPYESFPKPPAFMVDQSPNQHVPTGILGISPGKAMIASSPTHMMESTPHFGPNVPTMAMSVSPVDLPPLHLSSSLDLTTWPENNRPGDQDRIFLGFDPAMKEEFTPTLHDPYRTPPLTGAFPPTHQDDDGVFDMSDL